MPTRLHQLLQTHVDDGGAAVQVFVQVVQHLPQLLHVPLVGLQQHGLEVHRQPVPAHHTTALSGRGWADGWMGGWMINLLTLIQTPQTLAELLCESRQ